MFLRKRKHLCGCRANGMRTRNFQDYRGTFDEYFGLYILSVVQKPNETNIALQVSLYSCY